LNYREALTLIDNNSLNGFQYIEINIYRIWLKLD